MTYLSHSFLSFQARKNLVAIFQSIVDERRNIRKIYSTNKAKDMMDSLIDVEDDNGRKLSDEAIIDIMLMYLNAGHESSGHITMWATYFLQKHPEYLQKAKVLIKLLCYYSSSKIKITNENAFVFVLCLYLCQCFVECKSKI
jgi:cytochrome P450